MRELANVAIDEPRHVTPSFTVLADRSDSKPRPRRTRAGAFFFRAGGNSLSPVMRRELRCALGGGRLHIEAQYETSESPSLFETGALIPSRF